MSDIVERLRIAVNSDAPQFPPTKGEVRELLDEIERLTDTSKRLRAIEAQQTGEIAALEARLAEAVEVVRKCLNYIENTEAELGITLGSGDAARAAIRAMGDKP